ncbi:hypothetical protein CU788_19810 [Salmonella enterica]|nr:hypothetical protein [Salmonella enterica]EGW2853023.1 hypothetical protein [Salmonella enterica]
MNTTKLISSGGKQLLNAQLSWEENMKCLLSAKHWEDALAYWTLNWPMETVIRWLLPQLKKQITIDNTLEMQCLEEITLWLEHRDNTCRWRIFTLAGEIGFSTPEGALGLAVFWFGGSMTPENCEPVFAKTHLPALMVHTTFCLASVALAAESSPVIGVNILFDRWLQTQRGAC